MLKKILNLITHRIFIVGLLLLIQIIILILAINKFEQYGLYCYALFFVLGVLILLKIINDNANPNYKIAWIIPVLTIPIFGTLMYLIFGNKLSDKDKKMLANKNNIKDNLKQDKKVMENIKNQSLNFYNQANYLYRNAYYPVYDNTYTEYLKIGEVYFQKLIEELKKAEKYIFMQYFIIEEGKFWNSILDILIEKAQSGVDVRVIYDDMGCIVTLPNKYYERLRKYGIKACSFNKFIPILTAKLNNRDHRKITVIDGKVAFTGGINLADEYINEFAKYGHWKDNGILIKGNAVWNFTVIFLSLWNYINKKEEDINLFKPKISKIKAKGFVQPYDDTPLDEERVSHTVYLNLINKAEEYIYITTPYLIIDDELENALCVAAKSGIDVRIITPFIPDKKLVNEVTKAYYNLLLNSGVKIYEYSKGFIHAKTFLVDGKIATVGTVNLDYRSLYLHFECGVLMYKTDCITDIKTDFDEIIKISKKVLVADIKVNFFRKLKRAILRLFAPLM